MSGRHQLAVSTRSLRSSQPSQNILRYLEASRGQSCSGDVIIYCSNGTVTAHRLVLAAVSQMLFLELSRDQTEDAATIIFPDVTTEQLSLYLQAVYGCQDLAGFSDLNKMTGFQSAVHFLPSLRHQFSNLRETGEVCNGEETGDGSNELIPEVKMEEIENFIDEVGKTYEQSSVDRENGPKEKHARRKKSIVWKYFAKDPKAEASCICQICQKVVISNDFSTSNMMSHLVTHHGINKRESTSISRADREQEEEGESKKPKKTRKKRSPVWEHFVKDPDDVAGTRCVCQICQKIVLSINVSSS